MHVCMYIYIHTEYKEKRETERERETERNRETIQEIGDDLLGSNPSVSAVAYRSVHCKRSHRTASQSS